MTNDESNISAAFDKERRKIFSKTRKCFLESCNEKAIDSHVLQKNGFISVIAEKGQVYEHEFYPLDEKNFTSKRKE